MSHSPPQPVPDRLMAGVSWIAGVISLAWFLFSVLTDGQSAGTIMSVGLWEVTVSWLGGSIQQHSSGLMTAEVSFLKLLLLSAGFCGGLQLVGWGLLSLASRNPETNLIRDRSAFTLLASDTKWWCLLLVWQLLSITALLAKWEAGVSLVTGTIPFWFAVSFALANSRSFSVGPRQSSAASRFLSWPALLGMLLFIVTCTTMNWQLFANLQIPHGDSAMYEEHLWNLTHGKGFRSYLDQGLFLGEHIQVIHLLLIPIYTIWPSHELLELCEAVALGLCAVPVYRMTLRHTESRRTATLLALAALVYFPLHFLEISIDLKTFRPISFGVPLLLMTIDTLERKQYRWAFCLWLPLTLLAKEDFAAIFAPLGLWIAWRAWTEQKERTGLKAGLSLTIFSLAYLLFLIKFAIPFFREGADVHYVRYFGELGNSPGDIVRSLFAQPGAVFGRLFSQRTIIYTAALLVPLGGLPLLSPSRLLVGVPLFGVLSLMQLSATTGSATTDILIPFHHFHAPLVPILFWSAAAGLGKLTANRDWHPARGASLALLTGIATSVFFSLSPLGIAFWDPHSVHYWKSLYIVNERANLFEKVLEEIPQTARVASTDFVHPRFTHYERSYDYSQYARKVSGYELRVPDDTDYIVIDTGHRYSWIRNPAQIPELQEHPERWEVLPDYTRGYFIVLKRRDTEPPESSSGSSLSN